MIKSFIEILREDNRKYANAEWDNKKNRGRPPHPIDVQAYKEKGLEFARKHGVNVPESYTNIVIKPKQSSGGRGIIFVDGQTEYFAQEILWQDGHLPDDWKAHTFNGYIAMWQQIRRHTKNPCMKFYNADFSEHIRENSSEYVKNCKFIINPGLRKPTAEQQTELTATAQRLSIAIKYPYCRVDLYITDGGIYFGELGAIPGGMYKHRLSLATDIGFAMLWYDAKKQIEGNRYVQNR
jgi:hypothetical protein